MCRLGSSFGYFTGAQRTASAARLLTSWRLATLGAIVAGGLLGSGVIGLSVVLLLGNLGGAAAMMRRLRHDHRPQSSASPSTELGPEQRVEQGTGKPESPSLLRAGREVIRSTGAMAFWSIAMLCITGLDLIVVGRVDFSAVGAYAIAASLTAAITGLGNALQLPMMPRLAATRTRAAMMSRLGWMTGINAVAVIGFAAAVILVVGTPLIGVLAPHTLRSSAAELTVILTAAVALRLMGGPLALALIASGASNRVFVPQLLESIVNVVASITLGVLFGAVGVAFGTLIGAVCGLLGLLLGSIPRWFGRTWLRPIAAALLWDPLRCAGPLVAVVVAYLCGAGWALTDALAGCCLGVADQVQHGAPQTSAGGYAGAARDAGDLRCPTSQPPDRLRKDVVSLSVLLTGGAGFIGCEVAGRLVEEGHDVSAVDNLHGQVHGPGRPVGCPVTSPC